MKQDETKYNFTEREKTFIRDHLSNNDCGAETPEHLLDDNFSCQAVEDFIDMGYEPRETGGFLASLEKKGVITIEKRDRDSNLYWISDDFLEALVKSGEGKVAFKQLKLL